MKKRETDTGPSIKVYHYETLGYVTTKPSALPSLIQRSETVPDLYLILLHFLHMIGAIAMFFSVRAGDSLAADDLLDPTKKLVLEAE
jgi:hypothetical protein